MGGMRGLIRSLARLHVTPRSFLTTIRWRVVKRRSVLPNPQGILLNHGMIRFSHLRSTARLHAKNNLNYNQMFWHGVRRRNVLLNRLNRSLYPTVPRVTMGQG